MSEDSTRFEVAAEQRYEVPTVLGPTFGFTYLVRTVGTYKTREDAEHAAASLTSQSARIAELEAKLEAIEFENQRLVAERDSIQDAATVAEMRLAEVSAERDGSGIVKFPATGATKEGEWKIDFDWLQSVQNQIGQDEEWGYVALETIEGVLLAASKVPAAAFLRGNNAT